MQRKSKQTALIVVLAMAVTGYSYAGSPANAGRYPQRAIHLIVPYPAGGRADYWGQLVGRRLGEALGQPVIIKPQDAFAPIALLDSSPIVLVAANSVPAQSAAGFIAVARLNPGKFSYASNGNGSPEQVAGEIFKSVWTSTYAICRFPARDPHARQCSLTKRP